MLNLNLETGLIEQANQIQSPNYDEREPDCFGNQEVIQAIIIHCISLPPGQYQGDAVCDFFCNKLNPESHSYFNEIKDLKVSSHFFIRRQGELIQFVPTHKRAWHAGESFCLGKPKANNFTIGIELEGLDTDEQGFTDQQYAKLASLCDVLMQAYPSIQAEHMFAHSDIATLRKPDPGPYFDWPKLFSYQKNLQTES